MAGPNLSRFLGRILLRDRTDPNKTAAVNSEGEVFVTDATTADKLDALLEATGSPAGGGITWGAPTPLTLNGSSQTLVAPNAARKAIQIINRIGNAQAAYDLSGGTVTLVGGIPLSQRDFYTGPECPVGAITIIGTAGQIVTIVEGT